MKQTNFEFLRNEYETLFENIKKISQVHDISSISEADREAVEDWIQRLKQPKFHVVFVGTFNAGKSTIINALLGRVVLPYGNEPLTGKATVIKRSDTEGIITVNKDGSQRTFDIEMLSRLVTKSKETINETENIELVEVYVRDLPFDDDIVLVDTPGFDAYNDEHKRITNDYLKTKAHACVICFDIGLVGSVQQDELIKFLSENQALSIDKMFWAINKWDTKSEKEQRDAQRSLYNLIEVNKTKISPSKLYKISAGTYLGRLLRQKEATSSEEQDFINSMGDSLTSQKPDNLEKFKRDLFDYLTENAKRDFYLNAENSLKRLNKKLREEIQQLLGKNIEEEEQIEKEKNRIRFEEVERIYKEFKNLIESKAEKFNAERKSFWNDNRRNAVNASIQASVREIIDNIKANPRVIHGVLDNKLEVPSKIINTPLDKEIFSSLQKPIKEFVYDQYSYPLISEIRDKINWDLPEAIERKFEDLKNLQRLDIRIRGWLDGAFHTHTYAIHDLVFKWAQIEISSLNLNDRNFNDGSHDANQINNNNNLTKSNDISSSVTELLREMVDMVLGVRIEILLNNYLADIISEVEEILETNKSLIAGNITDDSLNLEERMHRFKQERELLKEVLKSTGSENA
jgi:GTPase Era involved in 16S rRNA processing